MISVIFGLLAVIIGAIGMQHWSSELVGFLKGMLPIAFLLSGFIAIIAGASNRKPKSSSREKGT